MQDRRKLFTRFAAFAGVLAALTSRSALSAARSGGDKARARRVETARRFFELLALKDIDAWSRLWAENGRILVFYPPEGFGSSIDGKAAILTAFRDLFKNFEWFKPELTAVYPAVDSDAVVVEYTVRAMLVSGVEYTNSNITVFRFENGLISVYHDYFDPRRFQIVIDALRK